MAIVVHAQGARYVVASGNKTDAVRRRLSQGDGRDVEAIFGHPVPRLYTEHEFFTPQNFFIGGRRLEADAPVSGWASLAIAAAQAKIDDNNTVAPPDYENLTLYGER